MSIKALIVDDEPDARDVLEMLLKPHDNITVVDCVSNVIEAVQSIKTFSPDVVFLDVEMPKHSGYELVTFFNKINFHIIFVTAYDKYALRAFEVNAVDYLLKPINRDKLKQAIFKIEDKKHKEYKLKHYQKLIKELTSKNQSEKVVLNEVGKKRVLDINDIIAVEAQGTYSKVYVTKEFKPILISKNIGYFENFFPVNHKFYRTHKSWYVNTNHIVSFNKGKGEIELSNHLTAKLSKYKKANLKEYLR